MEINILLLLKWIIGGLIFCCFGWLVDDRKNLKSKVDKIEDRLTLVEKRQGVIKSKVDNLESSTSALIDLKLEPIHDSLDMLTQTITLMRQDVLTLLNKVENQSDKND